MIARLASVYVRFLFALAVLLFTLSLVFHISVLIGVATSYPNLTALFGLANLIAGFSILPLAKERNVWKNEFRTCPPWMRQAVRLFAIYGLVAMFLGVAVIWNNGSDPENGMPVSAFFVGFDAVEICVLYSVLWAAPVEPSALIGRMRNSMIGVILIVTAALAYHAGYLHHPDPFSRVIRDSN